MKIIVEWETMVGIANIMPRFEEVVQGLTGRYLLSGNNCAF